MKNYSFAKYVEIMAPSLLVAIQELEKQDAHWRLMEINGTGITICEYCGKLISVRECQANFGYCNTCIQENEPI